MRKQRPHLSTFLLPCRYTWLPPGLLALTDIAGRTTASQGLSTSFSVGVDVAFYFLPPFRYMRLPPGLLALTSLTRLRFLDDTARVLPPLEPLLELPLLQEVSPTITVLHGSVLWQQHAPLPPSRVAVRAAPPAGGECGWIPVCNVARTNCP